MNSHLLKPLPENFNPKNIIVSICKGMRIGDVILATPLFRALKKCYPHSSLSVLTTSYTSQILWGNSFVDKILLDDFGGNYKPFKRLFYLLKLFRKGNFDLSLNICSRTNEVIASYLAGIKVRVGPITGHLHDYLLNYRFHSKLNGWSDSSHRVEYLLEYCRVLGNNILMEEEKLDLYFPSQVKDKVVDLMKAQGSYGLKEPLIIIHPGFSRPMGHFNSDYYLKLCKSLIKDLDAYILLTGPENEYLLTRTLINELKPRVFDWVGKTNLHELCALISMTDLIITTNTGTLHIASAIGIPVVALFNPTCSYSAVWRPYGVPHCIIESEASNDYLVNKVLEGAAMLIKNSGRKS